MDGHPLISICIPAFKRTDYLKRLLDSIEIQSFRDFEVVITDDSPGMEVQVLTERHPLNPYIRYFKNSETLGSPENWNEAIRKSRASWIKIMHDDDWFEGSGSLSKFAEVIPQATSGFYFSGFTNVFPDGSEKIIKINRYRLNEIKKIPEILLAANRIGPPSAVLFKKDEGIGFDSRLQWLVDIDFYIRYLKKHPSAAYIEANLVLIGISESQVTQRSFGKPSIEIPERLILNEKLDPNILRVLPIFDSWWRFIRNLSIQDISKINESGYGGIIPGFIPAMIKSQERIPKILLRNGLFSKFFMLLYYTRTAAWRSATLRVE
jgi:glycosyltransferase involved in cell wall biosynthesis